MKKIVICFILCGFILAGCQNGMGKSDNSKVAQDTIDEGNAANNIDDAEVYENDSPVEKVEEKTLDTDNKIYEVGDHAPDFELVQINNNNERETVRLSDLRGKGVMLYFWATYVEPSKIEMPFMEELYPGYKNKGIEMVAISLDSTEVVVDNFAAEYGITFPIAHDEKGDVRDLYNIIPIPTSYFINPDGEIVKAVMGALTLETLESNLQQIQPD